MANVVVEHEWSKEDGEAVIKVVGNIVDMAGNGKLPDGFSLKTVDLFNGESRAICRWEAPSASALSDLMGSVNPPTKHRISEVQKIL